MRKPLASTHRNVLSSFETMRERTGRLIANRHARPARPYVTDGSCDHPDMASLNSGVKLAICSVKAGSGFSGQ